ncbi:MAG: hypothetical protein LBM65_04110 [Oscillospiraceae bacterium]|nr:hypothetical protein [Oscillospiraceae bacterium]
MPEPPEAPLHESIAVLSTMSGVNDAFVGAPQAETVQRMEFEIRSAE